MIRKAKLSSQPLQFAASDSRRPIAVLALTLNYDDREKIESMHSSASSLRDPQPAKSVPAFDSHSYTAFFPFYLSLPYHPLISWRAGVRLLLVMFFEFELSWAGLVVIPCT